MSDAFKCDFCEIFGDGDSYHDGRPAEQLYQKVESQKEGVSYKATVDICQEHQEMLDLTDYTF